ncbi:hypothetical protein G6027_13265, partial [Dietzia sp. SLG310A2-38A2]|nr:hypothetical protein [Dietzia sp. SLG310A2-38A2]
ETALRAAADTEAERWTAGGTVDLRGRSTPTTLAWPTGPEVTGGTAAR